MTLERFVERWNHKYPHISWIWRQHWRNMRTLFRYLDNIRKVIYTVESLNSAIRKAVKKHKLFHRTIRPGGSHTWRSWMRKKKWTMPIRNWKGALNRFIIACEDRLTEYV